MATDINEQVTNAYNAAKQALNDDLTLSFYNAANARTQAFRQLNNSANAQHAMYSGVPIGSQMRYDQGTFLPNAASLATKAIEKLKANQDTWDEYMDYIKQLNDQAAKYNQAAQELKVYTGPGTSQSSGMKEVPSGSAYSTFAGE